MAERPELDDRRIARRSDLFCTNRQSRFKFLKYAAWVEHAFRGTALDWIVFTGRSARLPDNVIQSIRQLPIALIHVNHVFTLGFAQRLLRQVTSPGDRVSMILETHGILAEFLHGRGEINPWTHSQDTLERLLRCELASRTLSMFSGLESMIPERTHEVP